MSGRGVRRPDLTLATEDHNTPTLNILAPIADPVSRTQVETLRRNAAEFGIRIHSLGDRDQGVVHIIGPQLGVTQPGMTIVCGDSHTSTHGAFGALAFGIGTSEVEHVLATQTLPQKKPRMMAVNINGDLPPGVTAKDVVLALIAKVGTGGGQGYIVEYRGSTIEQLSMEGRMTICNMSIEWGAKAGMIAPDETTLAYLKGRPHAPEGTDWDAAVACWRGEVMDQWRRDFMRTASKKDFPIHRAYYDLTDEERHLLWHGAEDVNGIDDFFADVEVNVYKIQYRVLLARYRGKTTYAAAVAERFLYDTTATAIMTSKICGMMVS